MINWGGGEKGRSTLTERMSRNLEKSKKIPKQVPAGQDNRADILHKARFLPGHTAKNSDIWLQARQEIGLTGLEPVSKYDFEGTGTSDKINSALIAKLHNPGGTDFSIKMMSPKALEAARGGGLRKIQDTLPKILTQCKKFAWLWQLCALQPGSFFHGTGLLRLWIFS